jgi:hypothetical protein
MTSCTSSNVRFAQSSDFSTICLDIGPITPRWRLSPARQVEGLTDGDPADRCAVEYHRDGMPGVEGAWPPVTAPVLEGIELDLAGLEVDDPVDGKARGSMDASKLTIRG